METKSVARALKLLPKPYRASGASISPSVNFIILLLVNFWLFSMWCFGMKVPRKKCDIRPKLILHR